MGIYRERIENNSHYNEIKEISYCELEEAIDVIDDIEYDLNQVQSTLEEIDDDSVNSMRDGIDKAFEQIEEILRKVY